MFTGNFPVHDAPPINFLTSGLLGASPSIASGPDGPPEGPAALELDAFLGLESLSEFEKTMKLSSPPVVAGDGFFAPPPPGLPPFAWPFLTIFGQTE